MENPYYKVLFRKRDEQLWSASSGWRLMLLYTKGERTTGIHGPILVFKHLENAVAFFLKYMLGGEIWTCETEDPRPVHRLLGSANDPSEVSAFWAGSLSSPSFMKAPHGTYAAQSIVLKERIEPALIAAIAGREGKLNAR